MKPTATSARSFVLYDDHCAFCVSQVRWLRRLDWGHTLDPVPMSDPRAGRLIPGVSRDELLEAMRCVTRDGRVYAGAAAFRHLALRLPLLVPLALLLWVPGIIHVAEWIYRRIARNRYVLSRVLGCEDGACEVGHLDRGNKEKPRTADVGP